MNITTTTTTTTTTTASVATAPALPSKENAMQSFNIITRQEFVGLAWTFEMAAVGCDATGQKKAAKEFRKAAAEIQRKVERDDRNARARGVAK